LLALEREQEEADRLAPGMRGVLAAQPVELPLEVRVDLAHRWHPTPRPRRSQAPRDRKSTRLNSSHLGTSYAVFCLKTKTASSSSAARARCAPSSLSPSPPGSAPVSSSTWWSTAALMVRRARSGTLALGYTAYSALP